MPISHDSTRPFPAFVSENFCRTGGDYPAHRRFAPRAIEPSQWATHCLCRHLQFSASRCVANTGGSAARQWSRHTPFHPNGRWFYSIQEEGSTIVLFDYDAQAGQLAARQTVSTLPPGFAGSNFCSEILVSVDGQFVYAGNRLHDSIGIFSVGPDGDLTFIGEEWTRGNYPRSFNFDPSGQYLYCCNQRADNITVFGVNRRTGRLKFTGHYTAVGNPSIIVFLDLAKVD